MGRWYPDWESAKIRKCEIANPIFTVQEVQLLTGFLQQIESYMIKQPATTVGNVLEAVQQVDHVRNIQAKLYMLKVDQRVTYPLPPVEHPLLKQYGVRPLMGALGDTSPS